MKRVIAVTHPVRATLPAVATCALLTACAGSLFQSKAAPPSVYQLSADIGHPDAGDPTGAPLPAVIPADLAVLRPRVRTGLETDRIAVQYADRRFDYFADARWSGPLDEVVQDLAVRAFRSGSRLRNVTTDMSAFASGYWLEIDVADFEADYGPAAAAPTIHVHLLARLGAADDRHILASFDTNAVQQAGDNRLTQIVAAYERAADAALAELVANTARVLGDPSRHP